MEWTGGRRGSSGAVTVYLNVYDLVPNNWGHSFGLGLYHTGVEIMGQEFSFYGGEQGAGGGIIATVPRTVPPPAKYRESIEMGQIRLSSSELRAVINNLAKEFTNDNYHMTGKNCNSFSDALCVALLDKHIPGWINRAATLAGPLVGGWLGPTTPAAPVPPAPKAFDGQGYTLSGSSTTATAPAPPPKEASAITYTIKLDDEQPVTALQFRLHDGSRAQASFNHSHTVGDVRQYIDNITSVRAYDLCTSFPKTVLADPGQTLAEAGLLNAVIIQQLN